ncbi:hypothetical protein [Candidatus Hodgkinia cicadicola]
MIEPKRLYNSSITFFDNSTYVNTDILYGAANSLSIVWVVY